MATIVLKTRNSRWFCVTYTAQGDWVSLSSSWIDGSFEMKDDLSLFQLFMQFLSVKNGSECLLVLLSSAESIWRISAFTFQVSKALSSYSSIPLLPRHVFLMITIRWWSWDRSWIVLFFHPLRLFHSTVTLNSSSFPPNWFTLSLTHSVFFKNSASVSFPSSLLGSFVHSSLSLGYFFH